MLSKVPSDSVQSNDAYIDAPTLAECKPISSQGFLPSITTAAIEEIDNPVRPGYHQDYGPFNLDHLNRSQYNNLRGAEIVTGFKHDIVYTESHDDGMTHGICIKIRKSEFKSSKKRVSILSLLVVSYFYNKHLPKLTSFINYIAKTDNTEASSNAETPIITPSKDTPNKNNVHTNNKIK